MFVLSTCGEEIVKPEQDAIVIGSIHGVVKNATTGARLSGVTVTWVSGDTALSVQSTTTDDKGYYIINGLNPGEYTLSFTGLDGFTEYTGGAYIPPVAEVVAYGDEDAKGVYYVTASRDASLYELTGGFKGVIWASLEDGTFKAASGAMVQFDVSSSYVAPSVYNTTSGEDGSFSLADLPAGPYGDLYVLPYSDGDVSYATKLVKGYTELSSGEVKDVGDITLTLATGTPFLVISNFEGKEDVKVDASLTGTFSKAIDSASFEINIPAFNPGPEGLAVSWTDNVTFAITPSNPFAVDTYYSITLKGISADGNSFNIVTGFNTEVGIELVSSNLWADENETPVNDFPLDGSITLTFSREVDLANVNTNIGLYVTASGGVVDGAISLSDDNLVLAFTPSANLEAGEDYNISGLVASTLRDDAVYVSVTFTTAAAAVDAPVKVTGVVLDTAASDWPVDWKSNTFTFEWDGIAGADQYRIYAKDTRDNPNFVYLGTKTVSDYETPMASYSRTVFLPGSFDYYQDDSWQTPFAGGTEVTFIVKAANDGGEGPASDGETYGDSTKPTQTLSQIGPVTGLVGVLADTTLKDVARLSGGTTEYLDDLADPTLTLKYTDGSHGQGSVGVWEWNPNHQEGNIHITVPKDSSLAAGDSLIISNFKDQSGNVADADTLILN